MLFPKRRYRSGTRWCAWRWTDVRLLGETYLRRLHLVQTPWFSVMLHWIMKADPQPDLHDHPVSFLSIPVRGCYAEMTPDGPRTVRWWNLKRAEDRHRIFAVADDTVTLVFAGPVVRQWGFHTPSGWIHWREYEKRYQ